MENSQTKIAKNQTAKIGDKYSYKYTDLAQIHDYLESINSRYIQKIERIDGEDYVFTKRCFDNKWEDEWIQGCKVVDATLVGVKNPAQEQGSALTYARRYSVLMAYGLATEDDDAQMLSRDNELKIETIEDARAIKLDFGKNAGKTLGELEKSDMKYLKWLQENAKDENIKNAVAMITKVVIPSEENQSNHLLNIIRLNELLDETGEDRTKMYQHYGVQGQDQMTQEQVIDAIRTLEGKK